MKEIKKKFLGGESSTLRVFHPNACRYLNKSLQQCHIMNENEKKRTCNERVLPVDHGTLRHWFSPFSEVLVEKTTSSTPDYKIYNQRNVMCQNQ